MNRNRTAEDLKKHYEKVYKHGAYETYFTFNSYWIWEAIIAALPDWRGKTVLEVGCGQGELSAMLSYAGAESVTAIDYSETAISLAKERVSLANVDFIVADGLEVTDCRDVVTLSGVLEHIDDPWAFLDKLVDQNLAEGGTLITVMPSFMNPRGYVWMTLQLLFDVPMLLSDLHFFSPTDLREYAKGKGLECTVTTFDPDWGCGDRLLHDFKKRLPNALRDADMDNSKVERLLAWLDDSREFYTVNEFSGASMLCTLTKPIA